MAEDINFLAKSGSGESFHIPTSSSVFGTLTGVMSTLAVLLAIISIIAMGGLFLYYRYQVNDLAQLVSQKQGIEDDLRPELVSRLVSVDSLLTSTKLLLQNHPMSSNVLTFLEQTIHKNASVSDASLSTDARKLDMTIVVPNYLTFAEQVKVFEASPLVEQVSFGSPSQLEKGIGFKVSITFKPAVFARSSQ